MIKILANDGIDAIGEKMLREAGFELQLEKIAQEDLAEQLNQFDVITVRSATKIRKELIDQAPNLKVIARGGVGLDNIDVEYAKSKGIAVINTPAASSLSVAELVFGHIFSIARFLNNSHLEMPSKGNTEFKKLKKDFAGGFELRGKTLGVIGLGRIGQETAKIGLALGMNVVGSDPMVDSVTLDVALHPAFGTSAQATIKTISLDELLAQSDVISLHVPGGVIIKAEEIAKAKDGVVLVNASRGGVIDEDALLAGLESGKVLGAGLDVFVGEPTPRTDLLTHPRISTSPHIGAATSQAQANIGIELAEKIIEILG
ncbi:D-2-hydroxyacid dehydrogenase [Membranihabitans marinus]|uniref:D-2-hydroxyacid dehydrogenase n=1 Tax=Membranihabitans marinus TaxID=1227546 RepID=UPI001F435A59|nr:D-2-hydroxyacid dehydrogenase [Membranihabitans marinus]